ncbi:unnamed protein product [Arabis nemorensis]|uniref:Response regulatory domain-containing protein n=1 Tax=Arabis nemorensis TaxID=586526 RepID=A0A565CVP5_9BRAS|nr:unnamed protein product [Arabis nemorensis]
MFLPSTTVTLIGNSSNVCSKSLLVKSLLSIVLQELYNILDWMLKKNQSVFRCLEEGAEDFLLKPVKLSDVRRLRDSLMKVEDLTFTKSIKKRELEETENVYSLDSSVHSHLKRAKI